MKKIINKEFKFSTTIMEQSAANGGGFRLIKSSQTITLAEMLENTLRTAPQGGFSDLKVMKDRIAALTALENRTPDEEFEAEDAVCKTIVEAGRSFAPAFASKEMIAFKEYFEELDKQEPVKKEILKVSKK